MDYWQLIHSYGGSDHDIAGYWRNVIGSAVLSALKIPRGGIGDHTPIAGVYRFKFEATSAVSCRAVHPWDAKNPLIFAGTRHVVADYSTGNQSLVPGWSVVLNGDVQLGNEFEIGVGCYFDEITGSWHRIASFGPRVVGFVSTERAITARNISGELLTECRVVATNAIRVENGQGPSRPFAFFHQTGVLSPESDSDPGGAAITFATYTPGDPPTVDVLIDGSPVDVYEESEGLLPSGARLKCDGATVYRFADGTRYQSGTFSLSASLSVTDTAMIYVSDGGSSVWISPQTGRFVPGSGGIALTQTGQSAGTMTSGGEALFKVRVQPLAENVPDLEARSFSLRTVGLAGSAMVDLEHQGSFLRAAGDALLLVRIMAFQASYPKLGGGQYQNIWSYLAANGVTVSDVS